MPKRWRIRSHDPAHIARLEREANVSAVVAQLLIGRGICDPDAVRVFLDPKLNGLREPDELPGRARRGRSAVGHDFRRPADCRLRRLRCRRHDRHGDYAGVPQAAGREGQFLCAQPHRRRLRAELTRRLHTLAEQRCRRGRHGRLRHHQRRRSPGRRASWGWN